MDSKKVMTWIIIILMGLSVFGFVGTSFFTSDAGVVQNEAYNGHDFYQQNGYWRVNLNNQWHTFSFHPSELEAYQLPFSLYGWLPGEKIYLGYEPSENISVSQHIQILDSVFYNTNLIAQEACLSEENCPDIPVISCSDTKALALLKGEETRFSLNDNCLVLEASSTFEFQKLTERLIYELLGVMG